MLSSERRKKTDYAKVVRFVVLDGVNQRQNLFPLRVRSASDVIIRCCDRYLCCRYMDSDGENEASAARKFRQKHTHFRCEKTEWWRSQSIAQALTLTRVLFLLLF